MAANSHGLWRLNLCALPVISLYPELSGKAHNLLLSFAFSEKARYTLPMFCDYIDQLYDTFSDAVCVSDNKGIVVLVNKRYSELTGLAKENVIGKHLEEMVKNGIFDTVLNARVVKSGENVTSVQHLYNGLVLMLDGHPIKDEQGKVIYVVTIIRDITALAELREVVTAQKELLETFHSHYDETARLEIPQYPRVLNSNAMRHLYGEASAIAGTDATVLLLGETGTGKDVMARHIHQTSKRVKGPFIKLDCGSIPENLIESELFGYTHGSFSGASRQGKAGLVEAANSGTLFLDEIGELPLALQSRLLRVLQDREVLRLGATTPKKVDVRVIAATNKDLEQEMQKGAFRKDLYYRLKVAVLNLPPLRQRKADILPLAQGFLNYYGKKYNKKGRLSPEVEQFLEHYIWPGNVRELENLIQGALLKCKDGIIKAKDLSGIDEKQPNDEKALPIWTLPSCNGPSFKKVIRDLEREIIEAGLKKYGSMEELAKNFQMDRSTIFRKLRQSKDDSNEVE